MHLPAAVGALGDVPHAGVREHFRAVPRRIGQIGERDRGLGADVAAAAAIAAARAGVSASTPPAVTPPSKLTVTRGATGV